MSRPYAFSVYCFTQLGLRRGRTSSLAHVLQERFILPNGHAADARLNFKVDPVHRGVEVWRLVVAAGTRETGLVDG